MTDPLVAPGVPAEPSERERAVAEAKRVLAAAEAGIEQFAEETLAMARQLLRSLGVDRRG